MVYREVYVIEFTSFVYLERSFRDYGADGVVDLTCFEVYGHVDEFEVITGDFFPGDGIVFFKLEGCIRM